MKKTVIFSIAIIYLISIIVVTFFGMQSRLDQFQVYMTKIEITSYEQVVNGNKYTFVDFNDDEGYASMFIEYTYAPDNASYPDKVSFSLSGNTYVDENGETAYYAEVSPNGEVVFYSRKAIVLTIRTTDGSSLSDSVTIICR